MTTLTELRATMEADLKRAARLKKDLEKLQERRSKVMHERDIHLQAAEMLSDLSEENTFRTLEYIKVVINKALANIFKGDSKQVDIQKSIWAGRYPHINAVLSDDEGNTRDLDLQTGSGVKEVISFLFTVCLISVRGGRKVMIMDELLSGLHPEAKLVMADMMGFFADEGFQFIAVEYGLDTHNGNNFGKIYNIENINNEAHAVAVGNNEYEPVRYLGGEGNGK